MSVRKKQVTSPARYTVKDNQYSPRNAVQEAFISETSLGNNVEAEYGMNGGGNFYSPQYRQEVSSSFTKNQSPRSVKNTGLKSDRKRSSEQKPIVTESQRTKKSTSKSNIPEDNVLVSNTYPYNQPYPGNTLNYQPMVIQKSRPEPGQSLVPSPQFLVGSQQHISSRAGASRIKVEEHGNTSANNQEYEHTFPNGDHYIGGKNGKLLQGYGVYTFTSQNLQYRGYFRESKMHGTGTLVRKPVGSMSKEQVIYDGEWMNGRKQGFGIYYYFDNKYYKGNWIDNVKEGRGLYKQPSGQYDGSWKNNQKHGEGRLTLNDGTQITGWWENDKFIRGKILYSNGDRYEGDLREFSRQGYGTYNYANNGGFYRGPWQNSYKHGENAQINYKNGDEYRGSMVNNDRQDCEGYYKWNSTGDYIKAQFFQDLPVRGTIMVKSDNKEYAFDLSQKKSQYIR